MTVKPIIQRVNEQIIKVTYVPENQKEVESELIKLENIQDLSLDGFCTVEDRPQFLKDGKTYLSDLGVTFTEKEIFVTRSDEKAEMKKKLTANGWVYYNDEVENVSLGMSYGITAKFQTYGKQILTGLGQYEDGVFDYSGKKEYMYQSNMRNAFPVMVSSEGYAIFIDTESSMIFTSEK
ncbi:MAG: hypothetical protein R3Y24_08060, partial [Eubacteriales bacterium]